MDRSLDEIIGERPVCLRRLAGLVTGLAANMSICREAHADPNSDEDHHRHHGHLGGRSIHEMAFARYIHLYTALCVAAQY